MRTLKYCTTEIINKVGPYDSPLLALMEDGRSRGEVARPGNIDQSPRCVSCPVHIGSVDRNHVSFAGLHFA